MPGRVDERRRPRGRCSRNALFPLLALGWGLGACGVRALSLSTSNASGRRGVVMSSGATTAEALLAHSPLDVVGSFESSEYRAPLWARNAHLHTILASGEVQRRFFGRVKEPPTCECLRKRLLNYHQCLEKFRQSESTSVSLLFHPVLRSPRKVGNSR